MHSADAPGLLPEVLQRKYIRKKEAYNFTPSGNLYVKEGTSLDTGTYSFVSNNQVAIRYFYFDGIVFPNGANRGTYKITNLTDYSATLTLSGLTPEGQAVEIINLKK